MTHVKMPRESKRRSPSGNKGLVLGLEAAAKINAVEGVTLTPEMQRLFRSFDDERLPAEERRRQLMERYGKKPE